MKTKTINLYQYTELSKESKETALAYFRGTNDYYFLSEDLNENLQELLKDNGIKEIDKAQVLYSLSYCQGDGCMFEGIFTWKSYTVTINHSGRYYHSNSKNIEIEFSDKPDKDITKKVYDAFNVIYENICNKLEQNGYAYIEYEDSEESILENMEANDYYFTEQGKIESLV